MITDILADIGIYLIYGFGALICWLIKGCRTKLTDEIENHKLRNSIVSVIIFILIIAIIIIVKN